MSQQFLSQILRLEDENTELLVSSLLRVPSISNEPCCICLESIGSLSPETGVIECEVCLPCSHRVGSACIATWLRTNNTCPVCRRVFFGAHQEHLFDPDLLEELAAEIESEHLFDPSDPSPRQQEIMDELLAEVQPNLRLADVRADFCTEFCEYLGLSNSTLQVARQMIQYHYIEMGWENHMPQLPALPALVASTVLYMVTHVMNEHRSLEEISRVSSIPAEQIRRIYRHMYSTREQLIGSNMLGVLPGGSVQDFLNLLPAPTAENDFVHHEEGGNDLEHYLIPAHPTQLEDLCVQHSDELDQFQGVRGICLYIARKIRAGRYLAGLSPLPVVAVSLYMASHLASSGTTVRRVSEVVGISEGTIRNAYKSVYQRRRDIVDSEMLETHEEVRRYRVLRAITWPAR